MTTSSKHPRVLRKIFNANEVRAAITSSNSCAKVYLTEHGRPFSVLRDWQLHRKQFCNMKCQKYKAKNVAKKLATALVPKRRYILKACEISKWVFIRDLKSVRRVGIIAEDPDKG